jgi:Arc/MetJ-type ribon-helix-helix transcriptional regulator
MPGRKPLYQSEAERPVTLCVRVPRDLYDQVQRQVDTRRMTMTDAILEALRLWLETPVDPRAPLASDKSHTIALQQLEARVGARVAALEAELATLRHEVPMPRAAPQARARDREKSTGRHDGYGAFARKVRLFVEEHAAVSFSCLDVAIALQATPKAVNQVLKRLLAQGVLRQEGTYKDASYSRLSAPSTP